MSQNEDGLSIDALQRAFPDVAKRTLQRYLARVASDGKLIPVGRGRARVYKLSTSADRDVAEPVMVWRSMLKDQALKLDATVVLEMNRRNSHRHHAFPSCRWLLATSSC
jgi:hypothetical protein